MSVIGVVRQNPPMGFIGLGGNNVSYVEHAISKKQLDGMPHIEKLLYKILEIGVLRIWKLLDRIPGTGNSQGKKTHIFLFW